MAVPKEKVEHNIFSIIRRRPTSYERAMLAKIRGSQNGRLVIKMI